MFKQTMTALDTIEERMLESFEFSKDDTEAAHGNADELLIVLIKALATDDNREQVKRIVDLFESMNKWYA